MPENASLYTLKIFSWNISNFSTTSDFQFLQRIWAVLIPSVFQRPPQIKTARIQIWRFTRPSFLSYKLFAEYLFYHSHWEICNVGCSTNLFKWLYIFSSVNFLNNSVRTNQTLQYLPETQGLSFCAHSMHTRLRHIKVMQMNRRGTSRIPVTLPLNVNALSNNDDDDDTGDDDNDDNNSNNDTSSWVCLLATNTSQLCVFCPRISCTALAVHGCSSASFVATWAEAQRSNTTSQQV
jgi:hypothetical protein